MEQSGSCLERRKLNELLQVIGIESDCEEEVHSITCDSRKVEKKDLFVAIEGKEVNGLAFKEEVLKKGAWVLTQKEEVGCFTTEDSREAYGLLLHAFAGFPSQSLKMIGVTGTNGKSTTAALVYDLLKSFHIKSVLIGTEGIQSEDFFIKTENTTPKSEEIVEMLVKMKNEGGEAVIMEISSSSIVQKRLAGCLFDILIYTTIKEDHLDEHLNIENYHHAKFEAMNYLKPTGVLIMNCDDRIQRKWMRYSRNPKLSYGLNSSEFKIDHIVEAMDSTSFTLNQKEVRIPLLSRVNAYNVVAARIVGFVLNLDEEKCDEWMSQASTVKGRFELVHQFPFVFVDYAHTSSAMEAVLTTLSCLKKNKLIVVFGCGGQRDKQKRPKMGEIACQYADRVILTSDNPRKENPLDILADIRKGCNGKEEVIVRRDEAIKKALVDAQKDDIIVLVGKGNEDKTILNDRVVYCSDAQWVKEVFQGEE